MTLMVKLYTSSSKLKPPETEEKQTKLSSEAKNSKKQTENEPKISSFARGFPPITIMGYTDSYYFSYWPFHMTKK